MDSLEEKIARIMSNTRLSVSGKSVGRSDDEGIDISPVPVVDTPVVVSSISKLSKSVDDQEIMDFLNTTKDFDDEKLIPRRIDMRDELNDSSWLETEFASPNVTMQLDPINTTTIFDNNQSIIEETLEDILDEEDSVAPLVGTTAVNTDIKPTISTTEPIITNKSLSPDMIPLKSTTTNNSNRQSNKPMTFSSQPRAKSTGRLNKSFGGVSNTTHQTNMTSSNSRYSTNANNKNANMNYSSQYHTRSKQQDISLLQHQSDASFQVMGNDSIISSSEVTWSLAKRKQDYIHQYNINDNKELRMNSSMMIRNSIDQSILDGTTTNKNNNNINVFEKKIKVAIRVRPFINIEKNMKSRRIVSCLDNRLVIVNPTAFDADPDAILAAAVAVQGGDEWARAFQFNHCLWSFETDEINTTTTNNNNNNNKSGNTNDNMNNYYPDEYVSQESLHRIIGLEIVENILNGVSSSCFAYGHTGTGKTYSFFGDLSSLPENYSSISIDEIDTKRYILSDHVGLIPRVITDIIEGLKKKDEVCDDTRLTISYMEIYNEKIRDLLHPNIQFSEDDIQSSTSQQRPTLRVREHPLLGPYVENLTKIEVTNPIEAIKLLHDGNKYRSVAKNVWNNDSSRSHAIVTLELTPLHSYPMTNCNTSTIHTNLSMIRQSTNTTMMNQSLSMYPTDSSSQCQPFVRLQMVDLAGSEKAPTRETAMADSSPPTKNKRYQSSNSSSSSSSTVMNTTTLMDGTKVTVDPYQIEKLEHKFIRRSLSTLGYIIKALGKGISFKSLPYRDTVLTWLLRDALNGENHTTMLATISPSHICYEETLNTLKYAERLCLVGNRSYRLGDLSLFGNTNKVTSDTLHNSQLNRSGIHINQMTNGMNAQQKYLSSLDDEYNQILSSLGANKPGSKAYRQLLKQAVSDPQQRIAKLLSQEKERVTSRSGGLLPNSSSSSNLLSNSGDKIEQIEDINGLNMDQLIQVNKALQEQLKEYEQEIADYQIKNQQYDNLHQLLTNQIKDLQYDVTNLRVERDAMAIELQGTKETLYLTQQNQTPHPSIPTLTTTTAVANSASPGRAVLDESLLLGTDPESLSARNIEREVQSLKEIILRKEEYIEKLKLNNQEEEQLRVSNEQLFHQKFNDILTSYEQMQNKYDTAVTENTQLTNQIKALEDYKTQQEQEQQQYVYDKIKIQSEYTELKESYDKLVHETNEKNVEIMTIKELLKDLHTENEQLHTQCQFQHETDEDKSQQLIQELRNQLADVSQDLDNYKLKDSDKEKECSQLQEHIKQLTQEKTQFMNTLEDLNQAISELNNTIDIQEKQIHEFKEKERIKTSVMIENIPDQFQKDSTCGSSTNRVMNKKGSNSSSSSSNTQQQTTPLQQLRYELSKQEITIPPMMKANTVSTSTDTIDLQSSSSSSSSNNNKNNSTSSSGSGNRNNDGNSSNSGGDGDVKDVDSDSNEIEKLKKKIDEIEIEWSYKYNLLNQSYSILKHGIITEIHTFTTNNITIPETIDDATLLLFLSTLRNQINIQKSSTMITDELHITLLEEKTTQILSLQNELMNEKQKILQVIHENELLNQDIDKNKGISNQLQLENKAYQLQVNTLKEQQIQYQQQLLQLQSATTNNNNYGNTSESSPRNPLLPSPMQTQTISPSEIAKLTADELENRLKFNKLNNSAAGDSNSGTIGGGGSSMNDAAMIKEMATEKLCHILVDQITSLRKTIDSSEEQVKYWQQMSQKLMTQQTDREQLRLKNDEENMSYNSARSRDSGSGNSSSSNKKLLTNNTPYESSNADIPSITSIHDSIQNNLPIYCAKCNRLLEENTLLNEQLILERDHVQKLKIELAEKQNTMQLEFVSLWMAVQELSKIDNEKEKLLDDITNKKESLTKENHELKKKVKELTKNYNELQEELQAIDRDLIEAAEAESIKIVVGNRTVTGDLSARSSRSQLHPRTINNNNNINTSMMDRYHNESYMNTSSPLMPNTSILSNIHDLNKYQSSSSSSTTGRPVSSSGTNNRNNINRNKLISSNNKYDEDDNNTDQYNHYPPPPPPSSDVYGNSPDMTHPRTIISKVAPKTDKLLLATRKKSAPTTAAANSNNSSASGSGGVHSIELPSEAILKSQIEELNDFLEEERSRTSSRSGRRNNRSTSAMRTTSQPVNIQQSSSSNNNNNTNNRSIMNDSQLRSSTTTSTRPSHRNTTTNNNSSNSNNNNNNMMHDMSILNTSQQTLPSHMRPTSSSQPRLTWNNK